tara:strand:+ start:733 stop:1188 length:456 start_codon:yes stop_codon:yes gene_type:complete
MLKTSQIGGKGTMRRKKKKTGNFFKKRVTENELKYKNKIRNINEMIKEIEDIEIYEKLKNFLDNELEDLGFSIEKEDLRKEKKKEIDEIKEDGLLYVYSILIKNVDKPLEFDIDSYVKIKELFLEDGIDMFVKFIEELENNIIKKKYLLDI